MEYRKESDKEVATLRGWLVRLNRLMNIPITSMRNSPCSSAWSRAVCVTPIIRSPVEVLERWLAALLEDRTHLAVHNCL